MPPLRARLRAGKKLVGALVRMPSEDVVEMLGVAGHDFVVVDCEHGPADVLALRQHIALAELHEMATLVRIGEDETTLAQRALDQGAQGIIAPHVDTPADAQALARAVHYPPAGTRGFATYPRAGGFGTSSAQDHRQRALESVLVLAMIESPGAVACCEEILGTSGIDGYLVGAADLQAASGAEDPSLEDSLALVRQCGRRLGVVRADLAGESGSAAGSLDDGAQMVIYNLTQVMMTTFRQLSIPR
jgi:4-hydroxy-2-oxoheptanedioate aldolase